MLTRLHLSDGTVRIVAPHQVQKDNILTVTLDKALCNGVQSVDFLYDYFTAAVGESGYFVIPKASTEGTILTYFHPRADCEECAEFAHMHCIGMKKASGSVLGIAVGMRYDFRIAEGVKDGHYYAYPYYELDGEGAYEDISMVYYLLPKGADYSDMAKVYRDYQLSEGGCVPLSKRIQTQPALKKAAESIEIRVRQGWKPVPSPIETQTPENEPEMHVACDFARVEDIMNECKRQGVQGAEFCLVGWNPGGHDGRFPQNFPPEPRLGGEAGLTKLMNTAEKDGYGLVCHTSSTAAYQIADCWDEEYLVKNKDGSLMKRPYLWGGGRPHKVCPIRQYERFEVRDIPKLAQMGFAGIHYIDVITILPLIKCYDPKHPATRKDSAEAYRKIMQLCRDEIGGFASEGTFDFAVDKLDYCMYGAFSVLSKQPEGLRDAIIPFWQLVYHGIVLYNPCTDTLNYPAKGAANRLKFFEYGGRPLVCFYANFAKGNNWMGLEDFTAETDDAMRTAVAGIRQMEADYQSLADCTYAFMTRHECIGKNRYRTTYENGVSVTVDYDRETVEIERKGENA